MNRWRLMPLLLMFSVSCASSYNSQLPKHNPNVGYRGENVKRNDKNSESLFVVLAFSGGGTRAAALSYGVLEQLRDTTISWDGQQKSLLDEVDVISSVSGGSFTAAYYGLYGPRIFVDFEKEVLKNDITRALIFRALLPWNLARLQSRGFGRIDIAARYYDKHIFGQQTIGRFAEASHRPPYIILNATSAPFGERFEFTQDQFDPMCSDVSKVKVGAAVAASSAFPGLLSPITFKNFGGKVCEYSEPHWVSEAVQASEDPRRIEFGQRVRRYSDPARRPYVHLIDGGVADNIGIRPVIEAMIFSPEHPWSIMKAFSLNRVKKLVVIIVNAKTYGDEKAAQRRKPPGLVTVVGGAAFSTMGNYSFESVALLKDILDVRRLEAQAYDESEPDLTAIEVGFASLAFANAADYQFFASLPTTLSLPSHTVDRLTEIGGKLLRDDPSFKSLCASICVPESR